MTTDSALREIHKFLLGEGKLDGLWFGDKKDGVTFWWRNKLSAILTAAGDQQPAPAGMVLVPRELTDEMEAAWFDAPRAVNETGAKVFQEAYAAMLAAAPAAPAAQPPTLNEAFDQVGAAMLREVLGDGELEHCDKCGYLTRNGARCACAAPAAQVADCCDTVAYCSSVRRCTAQDEARAAAPAVVVDEAMTRKIITDTIGFDFEADEFQTVNADDLLRIAAALKGNAS